MKHYKDYRQENADEIRSLIDAMPMAFLITMAAQKLSTGVFNPVFRDGRFYLHLNKTDEQFKNLQSAGKAHLVFFDYLCNIPSYWVDKNYGGAATSYYRFAEFECEIKLYTKRDEVARFSQIFLDHYQPEGGYAPLAVDSVLYKTSFNMLGIVELNPIKTTAKWKLGQNRSVETRRKLIGKLQERSQGNDQRAAKEVEKWIQLSDR